MSLRHDLVHGHVAAILGSYSDCRLPQQVQLCNLCFCLADAKGLWLEGTALIDGQAACTGASPVILATRRSLRPPLRRPVFICSVCLHALLDLCQEVPLPVEACHIRLVIGCGCLVMVMLRVYLVCSSLSG